MTLASYQYSTRPAYAGYGAIRPSPTLQNVSYTGELAVGTGNARYRSQISNRSNATTARTVTRSSIIVSAWDVHRVRKLNGMDYVQGATNITNLQMSTAAVDGALTTKVQSMAAASFTNNVRSQLQSFAGPTFLGELRDTIQLLRHPTRSLADLLRAYNHSVASVRQRYRGRQLNQELSSLYLQYQFALRPLLMEVENIVKTYQRLNKPTTMRVSGSSQFDGPQTRVNTSVYLVSECQADVERFTSTNYSCKIVGALSRSAVGPDGSLNKLLTLTGLNDYRAVADAAWELLPFSFVADYFANINDIIASSYTSNGTVAWQSVSTRTTQTGRSRVVPRWDTSVGVTTAKVELVGSSDLSTITLTRSPSLPSINLTFSLPGSRQLLNLGNLLNSLRPS